LWRAIGQIDWLDSGALSRSIRSAGPPLLFGLRLWASVCLALYVAFWLELDNAYWAGTSAAIVCQPQLGASLRKGWFRMIGTSVGAVMIVVITACFPQDRTAYLVALALWGAVCALLATLLRNFASYAAALAGYTAAIIAADTLGATGGASTEVFMLAVWRASEICIGIVCAGIVLAVTDLGGAKHRLAALLAALIAGITTRFTATLALAGPELPETQPVRREFARQVIALDPVIDQAIGESSQLRVRSPVLQTAVNGLLAALAGWRAVAVRLAQLQHGSARQEAHAILEILPEELRSVRWRAPPMHSVVDLVALDRILKATVRALLAVPAGTPSLRLLANQTAKVLVGISDAFKGLALLVDAPSGPDHRRRRLRFRVPDWLPSFVNAGRAFVTIGATEIFWILTAWPNGAFAITFAAIVVILFAPRADQAPAIAMSFIIGTVLATLFAAIVKFAALPGLETFEAFSMVIALYLVPAGALMTQSWQPAMFTALTANFVPLLAPSNPMSYDTLQFYNSALAIVAGCGAGALSFRLLPPLSPEFRTRRLLALTLRDLRRLAAEPGLQTSDDWEGHVYARLKVLPDNTQPLQRAQLLAALFAGTEIIHLYRIGRRLGLGPNVRAAFVALAKGNSATATVQLRLIDDHLASRISAEPDAMQARASILAISEALIQHASYFNARAQR
jgi:uncharacterized membrane protein YccC